MLSFLPSAHAQTGHINFKGRITEADCAKTTPTLVSLNQSDKLTKAIRESKYCAKMGFEQDKIGHVWPRTKVTYEKIQSKRAQQTIGMLYTLEYP